MSNRFKVIAGVLATFLAVSAWATADDAKAKKASGDHQSSGKQSEMDNAHKYFNDLDKNKNGFLTRDELPAGWRDDFDHLDTNKDGKLSFEELRPHIARLVMIPVPVEVVSVYAIEAPTSAPSLAQLQEVYDMLRKADANNDGKITKDEAKAFRDHAIEKRVDAIFKRCDKNNNEKISKDECQGTLTPAMFEMADKNKDGFITRDELKACCHMCADKAVTNGRSSTSKK